MAKETFEALISRMDRTAERSGDTKGWWSSVSLVLTIWGDVERGWFPAPQFDPRFNQNLEELAAVFNRFGPKLSGEAQSRAFA